MTWDELAEYLERLGEEVMSQVPDIIAETANEYFRETFSTKQFDKQAWPPAKVPKRTGSLLVESGNLVNSIRPAVVSREKVVISAGNDKVNYARVHNEGFSGPVTIPAHTRRGKNGPVNVSTHTRTVNIQQRQFMGMAHELNNTIRTRIDNYINGIIS